MNFTQSEHYIRRVSVIETHVRPVCHRDQDPLESSPFSMLSRAACHYWYPGTRLDAPQECGCDGTSTPKSAPQAEDPERSQAASHPVQ
jgi:hypothetical protein